MSNVDQQPTPFPGTPVTGAWNALGAILEDQRTEFEWWEQIVVSDGGLSCPACGEPLMTAPASGGPGGGVVAYCRYAGDHRYHVPGDVVKPERHVKMGRFG